MSSLCCWYTNVLLGHLATSSQGLVCTPFPTQSFPPYNGGTHCLVLVWIPLLHVTLHADHSDHAFQYPSTDIVASSDNYINLCMYVILFTWTRLWIAYFILS